MISLTYQQVLHDVALRVSALVGTSVTTISATYDNAVLNATHFKSADWPFNSFRDAIIMAVSDYSWAIADTGGHPWRANFSTDTAALADGTALPSTTPTNKEIIGVWGAVRDNVDHKPLTEKPLEIVRRAAQETWRTYPLYYFKMDSGHIYHTRTQVVVECCFYSQADQLTLFGANGAIPLPDALRLGLVSNTLATLTKDGAWESQARIYKDYDTEMKARIRAGLTTVPSKTLPSPTVTR